ncbi:unnamed protein product [Absidia cylindrospora]
MSSNDSSSALLLSRQLKGFYNIFSFYRHFFSSANLQKNPVDGFSAGLVDDNIYQWEIMVMGAPDTL